MALPRAEVDTGIRHVYREFREGLCGSPHLGELDEPFAGEDKLK